MRNLGVGIIGAGNISAAYLGLAPLFRGIEMRAVADINTAAAEARAAEFGVRASSVADLMAAEDIDVVVNLTIPAAHFEVSARVLEAGKHVYSEKPFVLTLEEGAELRRLAAAGNLRVGSAPDTFLGGAQIDAYGNLNSTVIGDHARPKVRFPGSGGANDFASFCWRTLVMTREWNVASFFCRTRSRRMIASVEAPRLSML